MSYRACSTREARAGQMAFRIRRTRRRRQQERDQESPAFAERGLARVVPTLRPSTPTTSRLLVAWHRRAFRDAFQVTDCYKGVRFELSGAIGLTAPFVQRRIA